MSEPTTPLPTDQHTDRAVPGPTGGRHPLDVTHLVMGVAFLALAVVWALITAEVIDGDDLPWVLPIPWILAGVGGLLAVTLRQRRDR
jgi:hypothetical protein